VATRYPARQRVERWRRPSKAERAAKHRLPGWESSSRFTGRPDSTKLRHEAREACSESEAGTLVGRHGGRLPGEALTCRAPLGSSSTCRANGEAVERTRVPSRRSEPRLFTAALRRLQRSRAKASIFHAHGGATLDGVHRRARGREAVPMAQHASGTTCLRRPNDVLRNVSPASRCAASFEFTLATRTVTIKPKTSVKRTFFVHRMCRAFSSSCSHLVCTKLVLHTLTHQDLHSLFGGSVVRGTLLRSHRTQPAPGTAQVSCHSRAISIVIGSIRRSFPSHFCSLWIRGTIFDYRRDVPITNGTPRTCPSNSTS
jgi:hypothetical protein